MDFYTIAERPGAKQGHVDVYPNFQVRRSQDLMIRGKDFYAVWDETKGLWVTDEYEVQRLVDKDIREYEVKTPAIEVHRKWMSAFDTNSWIRFRTYVGALKDNFTPLDTRLTFANTKVTKDDFVSKRLPYELKEGDISAYEQMISILYNPEERAKIEWAIGAIISGDSTRIQKFLIFYGPPGTGKSTVMNWIQEMFEGYVKTFDAKELTNSNAQFSMEAFKSNPLVAIQHDTDLSRMEDNTRLNSIVSHEWMKINEKHKPSYDIRLDAFLMVGSNKPLKIPDAKSGLIRRAIDVHPTGNTIPERKYHVLNRQVQFEYGAIAWHCLQVYLSMGRDYYSGYRPIEMMLQTDVFFNYIEAHYDIFKENDGTTLKAAYDLYIEFCKETRVEWTMPQYKFREELRNYFHAFDERGYNKEGERVRSWYSGFKADKFKTQVNPEKEPRAFSLVMEDTESLFDREFAEFPAQYAKEDGTPQKYWTDKPKTNQKGQEFTPKPSQVVNTKLSDLDTQKEHYVKVPQNLIVIDFDLEDADGNKSEIRNLEAASSWPSTYAEFSKGGAGIHLHYFYDGDVADLARLYEPGIEIKVFTGDTSLRRRLSRCNNVPVATLGVGSLPLKEKKSMNNGDQVMSERGLRDLIARNLRKEIHPGTKSSVDFIKKILDDAYASDLSYDVTDLRPRILAFANNSTHHSLECIKVFQTMKFKSEEVREPREPQPEKDTRLVPYDVEVFPNLFVVCWKYEGDGTMVKMINPSAQAIEELLKLKLIGFNNRRYDNHILYAASMGYNNEQLYQVSKRIINGSVNAMFGEAYNLSYTDIFDYSSATNKKSLKKWQVELGLHHMELGLDWDQPVPEELWQKVADYCANDVESTEAVHKHLAEDFRARQILAALSGLTVNDTTNRHSTKIIFGDNREPQDEFVYTDLSEMFPGYKFELGKSTYFDEEVGEGGLVRAKPGMYTDVAVLDVASMHPTSIVQLNLFGDRYTKVFKEILTARVLIKRGDTAKAKKVLDGRLEPFLQEGTDLVGLADALKTVVNSVYGLTSAGFKNPFRDERNIDNIVAKRGALFMMDLKRWVEENGFEAVHIKTDSIKIPNATKQIIEMVMEFGARYGYEFEHEATYSKMALVNDAVYIAHYKWAAKAKKIGTWEATGAQFAHPYVFKTLFSKEKVEFKDLCEIKSVTSAMYLDLTNQDEPMALADPGSLRFIGKTGLFCPVTKGGGTLYREKDGKYYAVTGTKGYRWHEAEIVKELGMEKDIDMSYFEHLVDQAKKNISQYGDFEWFAGDKPERTPTEAEKVELEFKTSMPDYNNETPF